MRAFARVRPSSARDASVRQSPRAASRAPLLTSERAANAVNQGGAASRALASREDAGALLRVVEVPVVQEPPEQHRVEVIWMPSQPLGQDAVSPLRLPRPEWR